MLGNPSKTIGILVIVRVLCRPYRVNIKQAVGKLRGPSGNALKELQRGWTENPICHTRVFYT
jgi:hypothetical protein